MKDSIIILCGGGPAPGMNTVVCSVAKTFLTNGYRVIGLHGGYSGLFSKNPRTEEIDFFKADAYFNRGGSYLQMSRFKPTDEDFEKILKIYDQEIGSSKVVETKDRPERILSIFAVILLIIGIIAFLVLIITALQEGDGLWFVYGLGALLVALHGYSFNKVFVNISRKLNKLK